MSDVSNLTNLQRTHTYIYIYIQIFQEIVRLSHPPHPPIRSIVRLSHPNV